MPAMRRLTTRDLALIALFAALIAALGLPGMFHLFGNAVPVTAQSLGVMLAGSILGGRRGFLAVLTFCALAVAGLPLLAGGRTGLSALASPSAGYFLAFPLGALVTGWLTEKAMPRYSVPYGLVANIVGGVAVVYAIGVPVQAAVTGTSNVVAAIVAAALFLPGDLVKAVVATLVAKGVHAGYPTLGSAATGREAAGPPAAGDAARRAASGAAGAESPESTVRHDGHLP